MARAIFISYRREDSEGEAGRLFDDLSRSFGDNSVFMDVSGINPGADFRKAIDDNVATCGVLLAIIGPQWARMADARGTRRLDDPNDWVRLEIASALTREIPVIPVLVHDAKMPAPEQLPDNLKNLAYRNSVELTHARWNSDVQLLTNALAQYVNPSAATDTHPVHATVAVQLPAPTAPARTADVVRRSNLPLILGIVVAAVLAVGVVGWMVLRPHPNPAPNPGPVPVNPTPPGPVVNPDLSAFTGTWTNVAPEPRNNALYRMEIMPTANNQLSVHAWGKCVPADCDWGSQTASVSGQQASAVFSIGGLNNPDGKGRVATLAIEPQNGTLKISIFNTYTDRGPTHSRWTFTKNP